MQIFQFIRRIKCKFPTISDCTYSITFVTFNKIATFSLGISILIAIIGLSITGSCVVFIILVIIDSRFNWNWLLFATPPVIYIKFIEIWIKHDNFQNRSTFLNYRNVSITVVGHSISLNFAQFKRTIPNGQNQSSSSFGHSGISEMFKNFIFYFLFIVLFILNKVQLRKVKFCLHS